jgi:hypothetical protein
MDMRRQMVICKADKPDSVKISSSPRPLLYPPRTPQHNAKSAETLDTPDIMEAMPAAEPAPCPANRHKGSITAKSLWLRILQEVEAEIPLFSGL